MAAAAAVAEAAKAQQEKDQAAAALAASRAQADAADQAKAAAEAKAVAAALKKAQDEEQEIAEAAQAAAAGALVAEKARFAEKASELKANVQGRRAAVDQVRKVFSAAAGAPVAACGNFDSRYRRAGRGVGLLSSCTRYLHPSKRRDGARQFFANNSRREGQRGRGGVVVCLLGCGSKESHAIEGQRRTPSFLRYPEVDLHEIYAFPARTGSTGGVVVASARGGYVHVTQKTAALVLRLAYSGETTSEVGRCSLEAAGTRVWFETKPWALLHRNIENRTGICRKRNATSGA